jgi:hypothetical protein
MVSSLAARFRPLLTLACKLSALLLSRCCLGQDRASHARETTVFAARRWRPTVRPAAGLSHALQIRYVLLLSRQGKVRLAKWYTTLSQKERAKITKEVANVVLARPAKLCNFVDWKDQKIVYKRYASLYFICGIDNGRLRGCDRGCTSAPDCML